MIEEKQKIVKQSGKFRIIIVDTNSDDSKENDIDIIITGSHCGINSGEYLASHNIKGTIENDAGIWKENAGIAGLKILEGNGIPGEAVSSMTAHIGNGTSTYEQGKISATNEIAKQLGITVNMPAREAADKMLEDLI